MWVEILCAVFQAKLLHSNTDSPVPRATSLVSLHPFYRGWMRLLKTRLLILRLSGCVLVGVVCAAEPRDHRQGYNEIFSIKLDTFHIFTAQGWHWGFYNPRTKPSSDRSCFVVDGGLALQMQGFGRISICTCIQSCLSRDWHRVEVVEGPSLEVPKTRLDRTWSNLV